MFEDYSDKKFISFETYKRSGAAVRTTVWFVIDNGVLFIRTYRDSGKAKRLRHNSRARLALSTFGGQVKGEWVDVEVQLANPEESERAVRLFAKKYGIQKRLTELRARILGKKYAVFACTKAQGLAGKN